MYGVLLQYGFEKNEDGTGRRQRGTQGKRMLGGADENPAVVVDRAKDADDLVHPLSHGICIEYDKGGVPGHEDVQQIQLVCCPANLKGPTTGESPGQSPHECVFTSKHQQAAADGRRYAHDRTGQTEKPCRAQAMQGFPVVEAG